ncbi:MAG: hypothetical protein ABI808_06850, partial [Pseudonocardiales bacterium]
KKPAGHGLAVGAQGPGTTAAPTSSTSAPPPLSELAPNGKYRVSVRVVSTTIKGEKVGAGGTNVWTVKLACSAGSCAGTAKSTSGKLFKITFDGTVLIATYNHTFTGPCVYRSGAQQGQNVPGTLAAVIGVSRFQASVVTRSAGPSPAEGVPLTFAGTGAASERDKILKVPPGETCTPDPVSHDKTTIKLVWVG